MSRGRGARPAARSSPPAGAAEDHYPVMSAEELLGLTERLERDGYD